MAYRQPAKNEAELVGRITKEIKKAYPTVYLLKIHGSQYQTPGIPDLMMCIFGLLIGIEVKHQKPGESEEHARGRVTPIQRIQIMKINEAGGAAGVALSPEEALDLIERALKKRNLIPEGDSDGSRADQL